MNQNINHIVTSVLAGTALISGCMDSLECPDFEAIGRNNEAQLIEDNTQIQYQQLREGICSVVHDTENQIPRGVDYPQIDGFILQIGLANFLSPEEYQDGTFPILQTCQSQGHCRYEMSTTWASNDGFDGYYGNWLIHTNCGETGNNIFTVYAQYKDEKGNTYEASSNMQCQ